MLAPVTFREEINVSLWVSFDAVFYDLNGVKMVSSQNVPLSKRPTVKTSHTQNVPSPSQNVPFLKQNVPVGQNVPSQNVPML